MRMSEKQRINPYLLVTVVCDWYKSPKNQAKTTFRFSKKPIASTCVRSGVHTIVVYLVEKYTEIFVTRTSEKGYTSTTTINAIEDMMIDRDGRIGVVEPKYMKVADQMKKDLEKYGGIV